VISWDIRFGSHFDLCFPDVYRTLKTWLQRKLVLGIWLGTPCEGLTQARRAPPGSSMPNRLRDAQHVRGLSGLREKDRQALLRSNMLADRGGILARMAYQLNIPGGEENPASSWLWRFQSRQAFFKKPFVNQVTVDYCSWGRPFRARTKLVLWRVCVPASLTRQRCRGRGLCDYSGQPHEQLSGTRHGIFATKQKNSYPDGMCSVLAKAFADVVLRGCVAERWSLFEPKRRPEHCLSTG